MKPNSDGHLAAVRYQPPRRMTSLRSEAIAHPYIVLNSHHRQTQRTRKTSPVEQQHVNKQELRRRRIAAPRTAAGLLLRTVCCSTGLPSGQQLQLMGTHDSINAGRKSNITMQCHGIHTDWAAAPKTAELMERSELHSTDLGC